MKLLLIDGYSLLYRAFFSSPPLNTKDGQPTGALYGFLRMVYRLLDEAQPDYLVVALDASAPTFRHQADASYKANRGAKPDDLAAQTARVRELLDGLSLPHYEHAGFEADDILGTLAREASGEGHDVTIVTGDGDALQLAAEKVQVMLTRRGVSDLECYTPAAVRDRYGFDPALLPDFKGLRGDSSDNIPGVPGIGDKTGMTLVGTFGDLEHIYEHLNEVTPPRIRDLLEKHQESAFHSRKLARIVTDLPIEIDLESCRYTMDDARRQRAVETARTYEFKSLLTRFSGRGAAESATAGSAGVPAVVDEAQQLQELEFEFQHTASPAEARDWLAQQQGAVAVVLDTALGIALATANKALYYAGEAAELRNWLCDDARRKIVHDAKVVRLELRQRGLDIAGIEADTMLMGYLLEPTRQQHPIPVLARKYLVCAVPDTDAIIAAEAKAARKAKPAAPPASLFAGDDSAPADAAPAAAGEAEASGDPANALERERAFASAACAVHQLEPVLRSELQRIEEEQIFEELELPLVDILVPMEEAGMQLDPHQLRELGEVLRRDAERLQSEIWQLAGEEFNIGSPKQLQTILFDKMGLERGRTTKTGHSTDVHTLEKLGEEHEVIRKILEYRATTKLKSTYVDALLAGMDPKTHRIHTNLNQTGAVSGRLSSSDPNLQNIPIRTEQGRLIRKAFVAPPDRLLLKADYSQIELRILAHITGDEPLVEAFNCGQDVHARTAADLFHVPVEQVDSEMRRKAKMTNYAIAYGVSGFGLAKQLGTGSTSEAQQFIKQYFEALPGVKKYMDDTLEAARACGYVETLMHRRRPLPELHSPRGPERGAAERVAVNHPIQGTAADIMKIAMLAVDRALHEQQLQARMIMQVHDELVFEVPEGEVPALAALLRHGMATVPAQRLGLRVPLEIDIGIGHNWNDTEPVTLDR
jgi:DNA polymerase-1